MGPTSTDANSFLHVYTVVRRLGGAYGGKVSRSLPVAAAAALAAHVTGRRTRLTLNRNDDMRMNGGALLTGTSP